MLQIPSDNRALPPKVSRGLSALARNYRQGWRVPDRRPIYEWARENVILPSGGTYAIPGRFDVGYSTHLVDVFHAFADLHTRQINILKAIQTGGSLGADVFFQWIYGNSPGPTLWSFQSDDDAMEHFTSRIEKTFQAGPFADRYEQRSKRRGHFQWSHLDLYLVGANLNSLQNKSIRYVILDECWRYAPGLIYDAIARTEFYKQVCKIVTISQAGLVGTDWEAVSGDGLQLNRHAVCMNPSCRHEMPLEIFLRMEQDENDYAGLVFESKRLPNGRRDTDHAAATAAFRCPRCGYRHPDTPEVHDHFNASGLYKAENPEHSGVAKTFRWTSILGRSFGHQARVYTAALNEKDAGKLEPLKAFYMKRAVLHWKDELGIDRVEVKTSDYKKSEEIAEFYLVFLTADYQEGTGDDTEHYIYVVRGWNADGSSRLVTEGRAETFDDLLELADRLGIPPKCCFKDGGDRTIQLATRAAPYGWNLLKGDDKRFYPWKVIDRRSGRRKTVYKVYSRPKPVDPFKGKRGQKRVAVPLYLWSNPTIKDALWKHRHGTAAAWEVPADVSEDYKKGIDSERKDPKDGRWKPIKKNNHPWDCECMQIVAAAMAKILNYDDDPEEEKAAETAAREAAPPTPSPAPKPPRARPLPPYAQPDQLALF